MTSVGAVLNIILQIFLLALLGRLILDYVRIFARSWRPQGIVLYFVEAIFAITDRPMNFVRRFVPPLRIGGVSLDDKDPMLAKTLLDLSQSATINDSLKLGNFVLDQLGDINDLHKSNVEQAGFAVLKSPDIPSILVETAFISNPKEEQALNNEEHQEILVKNILIGIKKYLSSNPNIAKNF